MKKLERLNRQVVELTEKRDDALKQLREIRICADCGAEEEG